MANLKTIAASAGVTTATVSRALRGLPNVDPATAERILRIAEESGYVVNPNVSRLMSHVRSSAGGAFREILGMIWVDSSPEEVRSSYIRSQFERGARARAAEQGYQLDIFHLGAKALSAARLLQILKARNIRGLIFGPALRTAHAHLHLPLDKFASVAIGEGFIRPRMSHARLDLFVAMRTALHQLKRKGFRRIALVVDLEANRRAHRFLRGAFLACHAGKPDEALRLCYFVKEVRPKPLMKWVEKARPDALLLSNDMEGMLGGQGSPSSELGIASMHRLSDQSPFDGIDQQHELTASHACDLLIGQLMRNELGIPLFPKAVLAEGAWREP